MYPPAGMKLGKSGLSLGDRIQRRFQIDWDRYRRCLTCGGEIVRLDDSPARRRHIMHRFRGISSLSWREWLKIKLRVI